MNLNILYEDKHLIVVEKPAKIPSQSDKTGDMDLFTMVLSHLGESCTKKGGPYLGLIHRLDRPVGGIMVFAKNKESNSKLSTAIQDKKLKKEYTAVVCGTPDHKEASLDNYLKKQRSINMSKIVTDKTKDAKLAQLSYHVLDTQNTIEDGSLSLVKIQLKTGRHHQIRVQFAGADLPLWGDNKYNKAFIKRKGWTQIALFASKLTFEHPFKKETLSFELSPPKVYPFDLFVKEET